MIALYVIAYIIVGLILTKGLFHFCQYDYNPNDYDDVFGAMFLVLVWPLALPLIGTLWLFSALFRRIL
ncbi:hypothetical protein [Citrobacter phage CVT22]|uniref:Uncharacterized protein n=1 Tax=Citrobacter phage CVT22 TaxID=1622234 RepID=A0A0R6AS95_9CAUD|nr:hypothetical protein APL39_gp72 [Citrobacter phage CVT22]AJT60775.1 hypothetical protein [Citrobacter phage CVT22]